MKRKKLVALTLAAAMILGISGCSKKKEKPKEEEKEQLYYTKQEAVLEQVDSMMYSEIMEGRFVTLYKDDSGVNVGISVYDFEKNETKKVEVEEIKQDGTNVGDLFENLDGNVEAIIHSEEHSIRKTYDMDLNPVDTKDAGEIFDKEITAGGVRYAVNRQSGETTVFCKLADDGSIASEIENKDGDEKMVALPDGRVAVVVQKGKDSVLNILDFDKKSMDYSYMTLAKDEWVSNLYVSGNHILYTSSDSLYDAENNESEGKRIFNLMKYSVGTSEVRGIYRYQNGDYALAVADGANVNIIRYSLNNISDGSAVGSVEDGNQNVIKLGVLNLGRDLEEKVLAFNKKNTGVRVEIVEYEDLDEENYNEAHKKGVQQLNLDITSGKGPDILDLNGIGIKQYVNKGLLEDLIPYFEKDSEISLDDLLDNVVEASKIDGKIYTLPRVFLVAGMAGATNVVGDSQEWTTQEFIQFAKNHPDSDIYQMPTNSNMLDTIVQYSMGDYIDWKKGTCSFDSKEFVDILEFCASYKDSKSLDSNTVYDSSNGSDTYSQGKVLLDKCFMGLQTYMTLHKEFQTDVTFKGFPSSKGKRVVILDGNLGNICINSQSKKKEGTWEFLKYLYSYDDNYLNMHMGYSVRRDEMEEYYASLTKSQFEDEEMKKEVEEKYGFPEEIATEEEVQKEREIVNSANYMMDMNSDIIYIIREETEALFSGQKSAKEVAAIIQSRISLYVKENS